ncbi:hypothetical protein HNR09_000395 [Nesterenkonia xinjiangensis]|uniref:Uncharacterized protein n=1 Tax=Nesterenkonia xinjiangensis TaxID=225327 RepID=A0A7Z0K7X8_9MICC|nr:hypothetical protein [Nesterenkonia xinjiangensis]
MLMPLAMASLLVDTCSLTPGHAAEPLSGVPS